MSMSGCDFSGNSGADAQYFGSDFHQMSHDLRTPLNAISGFAELLLMDEGLSPASAEYVRAILTGSEALRDAVVSYLDRAEDQDSRPVVLPKPKPVGEARPAPKRSVFTYFHRTAPPRRFRPS